MGYKELERHLDRNCNLTALELMDWLLTMLIMLIDVHFCTGLMFFVSPTCPQLTTFGQKKTVPIQVSQHKA